MRHKHTLTSLVAAFIFALATLLQPLAILPVAAQSNNQLSLDTVSAAPNSSGTLTLELNNQDVVSSGEIHFSYDSTIGLQLTDANADSRLDGYVVNFAQDATDPADVKVKVLFYVLGTQSVAPGNGTILQVDYTTTPQASGSSPLSFDSAKTTFVGEGSNAPVIAVTTTNGVVNIVDDNEPALSAIQPNSSEADATVDVTVVGTDTNFAANETTADFGAGINVSAIAVSSPTQVVVTLEIAADAAAGARDVTVTSGSEVVTLEGAFTIYVDGPAAELMAIEPTNGKPGASLDLTIDGRNTNFVVARTDADLGDDITINHVTVLSPTQAIVGITIAENAAPGMRQVTLRTGSESATLADGFRVDDITTQPGAATLYVDPSPAHLTVGETAKLAIVLSPGSTPVNGVQVHGQVDPSYLELVQVTSAGPLGQVLDPLTFDVATGVFRFGAGVLGQTVSEPFTLLTLEVKALQSTGSEGTPVTFLSTFPTTDIAGPGASVMEAARDGVVLIGGESTMATLNGRVDLQGRPAKPAAAWSVPLTLEMTQEGTSTPVTYTITTDESGEFTLDNLTPDTYRMRLKGDHTLTNRIDSATLAPGTNQIFFGTLFEGDIEAGTTGNAIQIADFGLLSGAYDKCKGDEGYYENADLNETDGCVTVEDFGLLSPNFNKQGDIAYDSPTRIPAPMPISVKRAVLEMETPSLTGVGSTVDIPLYVDPRNGDPIVGVTASYRFDPAVIQVDEVILSGGLSNILLEPQIDNSTGTVKFSVSAPYGTSINERIQVAIFRVTLKAAATGTLLTPVIGGPRDTNIAGINGSVMAAQSADFMLFLPTVNNR